ncbi:hypothetical protein GCM10022224_104530 [Nonomuraea antimicrobica]|uniref:Uncharacterized protein n=1 Tax=Nonomuraea antimicrobica TaxID=561173 RepID=A0ABP7ER78_9ACTN
MTALILLTCERHPTVMECDDDEAFAVETVAAARALWATKHPNEVCTKLARVRLGCEVGYCGNLLSFPTNTDTGRDGFIGDSITAGRIFAARHHRGWYVARRAGGRLVDCCQWHLGGCCVHHVDRSWESFRPFPTLDPGAVLPGEPGFPGQAAAVQFDLFDLPPQQGRARA